MLELDALIATLLPPAAGLRGLALVKSYLPRAHMACRTCMVEDLGISKTREQNCVHLLVFSLSSVFSFFKYLQFKATKWDVYHTPVIYSSSFASCFIELDLILCAAVF